MAVPPIILVLDISTLSSATTREWIEFSRVGSCLIPQVIYEEMRFLFDRSPDPDLERVAREFNRFYAHSGWKITDTMGHHPLLKTATSAEHALTRRARVSMAVAKCAYGEAQAHPNSLVVMVTNDRTLLEKVQEINVDNLCGISSPMLLQWCRTGQRPIAASQKLQQMRATVGSKSISTIPSRPYPVTSPTRSTSSIKVKPKTTSSSTPLRVSVPDWFSQVVSGVLALGAIALAGFIIWSLFLDGDFNLQQLFRFDNSAEQFE